MAPIYSGDEADLKRYILAQAELGSRIYGVNVTGRIYGPYAKQVRQNIMQALTGAKVPVSKCGATAVRDALFARFNVPSDCLAGMEDSLQAILEGEQK